VVAKSARSAAAGGEHPFMRWLITARASGVERHWRRLGGVAFAAVLGLALAGSGSGAPGASQTGKATAFTGYAFDACNAPKIDSLAAWLASPYRALGIYIGGVNRACVNNQLTPDWTAAAVSTGWGLIPLYVGLQAPCVGQGGLARISPSLASSQGTAAADDADARASTVGLAPGSPIYFDMEGYALSNAGCSQAVQSFVTAWVNELHALGHLAGIYGSAASTIRDMQALATTASAPDDVWIANWNDNESVYGDPYVSDALWTNHQRLHQYRGSHHETWGGVTIDIDSNYVDGAVVGAGGTLPVPAPPIPLPSPGESAAGSVTAVDESSSVSWPAGAFQQSVVVSLTPALPVEPVDGFGHGGYGVQLQVQQTATAALRKGFAVPLTIHIGRQPDGVAPMTSSDGLSWQPLSPLFGGALANGAKAGYTRNSDGSFDIQTTAGGFFALLPEKARPPAPDGLTARFSHGQLVLSWPKSAGSAGDAVSYRVTLGQKPLLSIPGQTTAAIPRVHHTAPSVYRVIATDAAGKTSEPSKPIVILPSKRPQRLPKALPAWAWPMFEWMQSGKTGNRPKGPKILPSWYWRWYDWRAAPFHVRA
jgi:Rv2525c-like, glycoside hydrolase-like domain